MSTVTISGAGAHASAAATDRIPASKSGVKGYLTPVLIQAYARAWAAGTITADAPLLNDTVTWNNAGVTFNGWKLNVTDTTSAAASLLMDLQVGGSSKFSVTKGGAVTAQSLVSSGSAWATNGGSSTAFQAASNHAIGWSSGSAAVGATTDLQLFRDAADTLALRRSTNAQTFRVYRSYTDGSNYSRLGTSWNTTTAIIKAEGAGTGTNGNLAFGSAALATDATVGHLMIPSCAGAPTGVPADIPTGQIALIFDTTNNKLYAYDGGWLATAALT